jgi:PadR family transcriptional regulator PadR
MMACMSDRTSIDLLQGTLATLILKCLSWGPRHGYGVARWVAEVTSDELLIEEGSLYPALHRLQARGLVTSEWTTSDTGRRVRAYSLTPQGRLQLRAEVTRWTTFSAAVSRALESGRPRLA